jgi:L,D-peptidoglycan transpeptidase YkuD (ErfK/YbiS/YcfS/YnhG family)
MDIVVTQDSDNRQTGSAVFAGQRYRCALGRGGVSTDKREGDGATPAGRMKLRRVFYRPDRLARPLVQLPVQALMPDDGWCDDPASPDYNTLVRLPHPARHERLWLEHHVYDVIVALGWNDDPVIPGRGSAIFLHVAAPGFTPTEGCVALALADLLEVLRSAVAQSWIDVRPASSTR